MYYIFIIALSVLSLTIVNIFSLFSLRYVIKLFENGSVSIEGQRGTGKDMLMSNVIARRKLPYVSNIDYHCPLAPYIPLKLSDLDIPNNCDNFINDNIIDYNYPYPEKCDIYLSDAGVYTPSQYYSFLDKHYSGVPQFMALSRHIADCNFHYNVQNLNRVWDKIREQSDTYIRCISCRVIGKIVIQRIIVYDKYQSCIDRVAPFKPVRLPLFANSQAKATINSTNEVLRTQYLNNYGSVKSKFLVYINKSRYDTRLFKKLLKVNKNEKV